MVIRSQEELSWAKGQIEEIRKEAEDFRESFETLEEFAEAVPDGGKEYIRTRQLEGALKLSEALLEAIGLRKESRGSHYRQDYPEKNEELGYPIRAGWQEGKLWLSMEKPRCKD